MDKLKQELRDYYINFRRETMEERLPEPDRRARTAILIGMERFLEENPGIHPSLLKARQHEMIADNFVPKLFPHSPFFYETGMRPALLINTSTGPKTSVAASARALTWSL